MLQDVNDDGSNYPNSFPIPYPALISPWASPNRANEQSAILVMMMLDLDSLPRDVPLYLTSKIDIEPATLGTLGRSSPCFEGE